MRLLLIVSVVVLSETQAIAQEIIDYSCHHVQFQIIQSKLNELSKLSPADAEKSKAKLGPLYELRDKLFEQAKKVESDFKAAEKQSQSEEIKASVKREQEHWQNEWAKVDKSNEEQVRNLQKRQNEASVELSKRITSQLYGQTEFQQADAKVISQQTDMNLGEAKVNTGRLNIPDPQREAKSRAEAQNYASRVGQTSLPPAVMKNDTMMDLLAVSQAAHRIAGAGDRLNKFEFVAADRYAALGGFDSKIDEVVTVANDYRKILRSYDSAGVAMMMIEKGLPTLPPAEVRQSWKQAKPNAAPELQQATSKTISQNLQKGAHNGLIRKALRKVQDVPPPDLKNIYQPNDSRLQKWQKETTTQMKKVIDEVKTYILVD